MSVAWGTRWIPSAVARATTLQAFDLVKRPINGEPGRPPVRPSGVYAVPAIASALKGCAIKGRGCLIDMSMFDRIVSMLTYVAGRYLADGDMLPRVGSGDPKVCPYGAFPTADGYIAIAIYGDSLWPLFCNAVGLPELATDPPLEKSAGRVVHRKEIESTVIEQRTKTTVAEWCDILSPVGIPHLRS